MNATAIPSRTREDSLDDHLIPFKPFLDDPKLTEICVNKGGVVFALSDKWTRHEVPEITHTVLESIATAAAKYSNVDYSMSNPIFSATSTKKERLQFVGSPVCESGTVLMTIRKPSSKIITMSEYRKQNFFRVKKANVNDNHILDLYHSDDKENFIRAATAARKTILVSGATHSGKTTFMRTLISLIDESWRLITIEDVPELMPEQENLAAMFTNGQSATDLLKSSFRMRPDIIILGEIRGMEAYDFMDVVQSGHGGSVSSIHASTCKAAFERMARNVGKSPLARGMKYELIMQTLVDVIDIVIQVTPQKRISEIYYKGAV